jgi:hypothetical protein
MAISNEQAIAFVKKNPVGFGCGVLCVLLLGALYYRSDLVPADEAELAQKSAEAERLANNVKNSNQLKEQLEAITVAEKQIESRLIHPADLAKNQQYFYKLEAETGVKIIDCRPNSTAVPKGLKTAYFPVPFTVNVQGDYVQVLNFLRRLENGSAYCRAIGVTFDVPNAAAAPGSSASGESAVMLSLNLELLGQP